ncbi:Protein Y45G5AL.1, isoform a [Corchorus olitorius]|uniref:Protein Y45G5AL.1, isoform a n=1 Tax=Corchorus olitorius TaxID=93759 RepID=A0A1R3FWH4_9ROSI|nr:Protein Y45G5AL.1, isoform a [Corchorus olitorius]
MAISPPSLLHFPKCVKTAFSPTISPSLVPLRPRQPFGCLLWENNFTLWL